MMIRLGLISQLPYRSTLFIFKIFLCRCIRQLSKECLKTKDGLMLEELKAFLMDLFLLVYTLSLVLLQKANSELLFY